MGDKSPKAKQRQKEQKVADKAKDKASLAAKQAGHSAAPLPKGKK